MKSRTKRKILALPLTALIVVMLYNSGNSDEVNNKLILEASADGVLDPYGYLSDMIEGAGSIFTALVTLVIRLLAIFVVLILVGFITGTIGNVTDAIKSKAKF